MSSTMSGWYYEDKCTGTICPRVISGVKREKKNEQEKCGLLYSCVQETQLLPVERIPSSNPPAEFHGNK